MRTIFRNLVTKDEKINVTKNNDKIHERMAKIYPKHLKYFDFAKDDITRWKLLLNKRLIHKNKKLGKGSIIDVFKSNPYIMISIQFDDSHLIDKDKIQIPAYKFDEFCTIEDPEDISGFYDYCIDQIPVIKQREIAQERLKKIIEECELLSNKYKIYISSYKGQEERLYNCLKKIDNEDNLSEEECEFMESCGNHRLIAQLYERNYHCTKNTWSIIKACSQYRKCNQFKLAINITNNITSNNLKEECALLTTRGAAFKDLEDITMAKQCAIQAYKISETAQVCNLLGAIYFIERDLNRTEYFFNKAQKFGHPSLTLSNEEIKRTLLGASVSERERLKSYLFEKDPNKYQWIMNI